VRLTGARGRQVSQYGPELPLRKLLAVDRDRVVATVVLEIATAKAACWSGLMFDGDLFRR